MACMELLHYESEKEVTQTRIQVGVSDIARRNRDRLTSPTRAVTRRPLTRRRLITYQGRHHARAAQVCVVLLQARSQVALSLWCSRGATNSSRSARRR